MSGQYLPYTQNRELSWLKFNERVLSESEDESVPLLERMKFVSIFTSNLDEFFMIRVGSIYDIYTLGDKGVDYRSGLTAKEQLDAIYKEVAPLYKKRDQSYNEIKKSLASYGVCGLDYSELEQKEKKYIKKYFREQIRPVLSPQIVDANHPFPHLMNKEIYVIADLIFQEKTMLGIVPVPHFISDIIYLPGQDLRYIRTEKVIIQFMEEIFEQYELNNKNYICVTRNADISPDDESMDVNDDFRKTMKEMLHKRNKMAVVRLEVAKKLTEDTKAYFCEKFKITDEQIFCTKVPMKMSYIFSVIGRIPDSQKKSLLDTPFTPQPSAYCQERNMMAQVEKKDILLSYPYEKMEPFLNLIREASKDPDVMTIKITIYRLASKARLVEYLCAAAENGKDVTVLIELRARFDEQNNIDWSERLEEAGCRIIYGFEGYKVHSKICLITYKSKNEIKYITQIGTGNYNEKTATMYTDISLMTADYEIGCDAAEFFKNMSIANLNGSYRRLLVAPSSLKQKILYMMDQEIEKGENGRIIMKMNSVTDIDFIQKVSEASNAGVKVDLLVRGICCIVPNIEGYTENVRITSIVGRFLEHPRIFSFGKGSEQKLYLGSADMMTRNTEKRVEVACPITDTDVRRRVNQMLVTMMNDNVKGRVLTNEGIYIKRSGVDKIINAQEVLMREAINVKPEATQVTPKKEPWFKRLFKRR